MEKGIVDTLNLTPGQKTGSEGLSEEQHEKIAESVDWDFVEPAKEPKDKKPDDVEKIEKVEDAPAPLKEGKTPEELRIEADRLEKEQAETDRKAQEKADQKKQEEDQSLEEARIKALAEKDGKPIDEIRRIESEKTEGARLKAIAKEEGITVEQVKDNEAKDKSIVERHKNDPLKIARDVRKQQSEYDKLKNENEALREKESARTRVITEQEFEHQFDARKDQIIAKYRETYPDASYALEDDEVLEKAKPLLRGAYDETRKNYESEIKTQSESKRKELVEGLSEEFKEYRPEVEEALKECSDAQVLNKEFNIEYLACWARGKKLTPEYIKSIEDAAYTRGNEQPKILGEIGVKKPRSQSGKSYSYNLTAEQKKRALDVNRREDWTDEQKYADYDKVKDNDF